MVLYRFSSIVYLAVNIRLSNMYDGLVNENLSVIAVEGVALTSTNSKSSTVKWFSHCSSDPLLPVPHYIFGSRDKPIRLCCDRIWGMNLFYLKQSDQSPDRIGKKTVLVQESQSYIRSLRFCNSISSWCRCSIERFQQKIHVLLEASILINCEHLTDTTISSYKHKISLLFPQSYTFRSNPNRPTVQSRWVSSTML